MIDRHDVKPFLLNPPSSPKKTSHYMDDTFSSTTDAPPFVLGGLPESGLDGALVAGQAGAEVHEEFVRGPARLASVGPADGAPGEAFEVIPEATTQSRDVFDAFDFDFVETSDPFGVERAGGGGGRGAGEAG